MYTSPGANVPGAVVKAITEKRKRGQIDGRYDILIDIGLMLPPDLDKAEISGEGWSLIVGRLTQPDGAAAYYVLAESDSIYSEVFDATIIDSNVTFAKYRQGMWVKALATHVRMMRATKRVTKHKRLKAGTK